MTSSAPLPQLPQRLSESHKGTYGNALLVGGSLGMSGAIALAGTAALRSGAGLVRLAVPDVCLESIAGFEPSYMTCPLPADQQGRISLDAWTAIEELSQSATCLACGPGLGRSPVLGELVSQIYQELSLPLVVDADALNALSEKTFHQLKPGGQRVLTPHPGEFRRLVNSPRLSVKECRRQAIDFAREHKVIVVLKGRATLITDGNLQIVNTTGNPGMATGGSGDVLTGIITALICQGLSPIEAAHLGTHLHGSAGDLAAEQMGEVSLIASDLVRFLPKAFQKITKTA